MKQLFTILICSIVCFGTQTRAQQTVDADVDLVVVDFDGLEEFLQNRTSSIQVINFWATWCAPCVKEMPHFKKLAETYPNSEIEVVLVSLDFPQYVDSKLVPYLKEQKIPATLVLLDDPKANDWIDKVSPAWSGAIPATKIVGAGKPYFKEGMIDSYEELETIVIEYKSQLK